MRIVISKPTYYIDNLDVHGDVKKFYDMLLEIIADMGLDYGVIDVYPGKNKIIRDKDTLFLAWHLHGTLPDIWHLKTGYLPGYFYFDKYGYSGWSSLAQEYDCDTNVDDIRDEMQTFCDNYISSNSSRIEQPHETFIPSEPYVLVLQQLPNDSVMTFAHLDCQALMDEVTELYRDTEYTVCTKEHPQLAPDKHKGDKPISISPDVFHATGSVHKIIAGASAVYTVNSGSGFEALLHGKRVFTSGDCDYHWVTNPIKTVEDLQNSIHLIDQPVDNDKILVFLHHMINEYFVNINDEQSIRRRLSQAIYELRHVAYI
jgi:hypothetical protein